jgi:ATPase subunit of ABC transporter with duplicated ATPase domains
LIRRIVTELDEVGVKVAYIPQEMDAQGARDILKAVRTLPPDRLGRVMTLVRRLGSDPARLLQSLEPSPGELRKLLLAQCLEREPQVVVLDEPTNHLDLPSVVCLEGALEGYQAALVMVSHDGAFLARLADSVWNIRPGQGSGWELEG